MDEIRKHDVIELSVTGQGMDGEGVARCRANVCARK